VTDKSKNTKKNKADTIISSISSTGIQQQQQQQMEGLLIQQSFCGCRRCCRYNGSNNIQSTFSLLSLSSLLIIIATTTSRNHVSVVAFQPNLPIMSTVGSTNINTISNRYNNCCILSSSTSKDKTLSDNTEQEDEDTSVSTQLHVLSKKEQALSLDNINYNGIPSFAKFVSEYTNENESNNKGFVDRNDYLLYNTTN
jgi:hypothetical protein